MITSQQALAEEKMLKTVKELKDNVSQLQSRLTASEQNAESQVNRLESSLKANQQVLWLHAIIIGTATIPNWNFNLQKSQQYAKLIWKLRQRLVLNTQPPSVALASLTHPQQQ